MIVHKEYTQHERNEINFKCIFSTVLAYLHCCIVHLKRIVFRYLSRVRQTGTCCTLRFVY